MHGKWTSHTLNVPKHKIVASYRKLTLLLIARCSTQVFKSDRSWCSVTDCTENSLAENYWVVFKYKGARTARKEFKALVPVHWSWVHDLKSCNYTCSPFLYLSPRGSEICCTVNGWRSRAKLFLWCVVITLFIPIPFTTVGIAAVPGNYC